MSKKFQRIIMFVYIISLILMITGATFAYFTVIKVSNVSPEVDVQAATTNFIIFDVGDPIRITPTKDNFGEGMGNLSDDTYASAYAKVAEGETQVTYHYNLFLKIDKNTLEYSTVSQKPELIMSVTDPDGNVLTNIEGLKYVTVNGVSGFDITNVTGTYYIAYDYIISTSTELMQKWNATVTFVNLEEPQDLNYDKVLEGSIQIEKAS